MTEPSFNHYLESEVSYYAKMLPIYVIRNSVIKTLSESYISKHEPSLHDNKYRNCHTYCNTSKISSVLCSANQKLSSKRKENLTSNNFQRVKKLNPSHTVASHLIFYVPQNKNLSKILNFNLLLSHTFCFFHISPLTKQNFVIRIVFLPFKIKSRKSPTQQSHF